MRHPHRERWHQMGRHFRDRFHVGWGGDGGDEGDGGARDYEPVRGTCRVQAVRSVSDWSHGVLTEHSIQNAYIQLILEAEHFVYIGAFLHSSEMRTAPDAPL